jgi:hypothetical protein
MNYNKIPKLNQILGLNAVFSFLFLILYAAPHKGGFFFCQAEEEFFTLSKKGEFVFFRVERICQNLCLYFLYLYFYFCNYVIYCIFLIIILFFSLSSMEQLILKMMNDHFKLQITST